MHTGVLLVIRLRSLQSIIILLSVFLLVPVQAMGTVLCIGADGHIALEVAKNGRCGNFSSPREHITQLPLSTEHCGGCIDVSLSASNSDDQQIFSMPSASPKLDAPVLALLAFVLPVSLASPQRHVVLPPVSRANTLLALRTVVLLL
jgi:hypothetical protein